jgi:beta-galactosidase
MGNETSNSWYSLGLDELRQVVDGFGYTMEGAYGKVTVEASLLSGNQLAGFKVWYGYTISPEGDITIDTRVSPQGNLPKWLPKMGLQMTLPDDFRNMEWFGRGPFETYPDRKTGAKTGLYATNAEKEYVPYLIPQDYGNKTDVRWLTLTDDSGTGIRVAGGALFNTSLQKYSTGHLDRARYTFQLKDEGIVTLNLDDRVSGVGCTAISVLNPYRVYPEETSFTFRISPLAEN